MPVEQAPRGSASVIARNSAFVMAAQAGLKVLAFLFQVFVVRSLGGVEYGKFATVLAYLSVFAIFSDIGLGPYMVREIARDGDRAHSLLPNAMAIRAMLSVLVIIVATGSAVLAGYSADIVTGIFIAGLGLFLYAVQGPLDALVIARERLDLSAIMTLINQVIFMTVGGIMLYAGVGFTGLILATLLGVGVWGAALWWLARRELGLRPARIDIRAWRPLCIAALPFGVGGVAMALMGRIDTVVLSLAREAPPSFLAGSTCSLCLPTEAYRYVVSGEQLVGWYAVPVNLMLMTLLVAQSVALAMYPTLVREYKRDPESIRNPLRQVILYLVMISLPIAVGATALADKIIITLYTNEFIPSILVLQIVIWAVPMLFVSEILGYVAIVLGKERQLAQRDILSAVVMIALNLALIRALGLLGAPLAYVSGRLVYVTLRQHLVGVRLTFSRKTLWALARVAAAAGVMGVGVFLLRDQPLLLTIGAGMAIYALALAAFEVMGLSEVSRLAALILRRPQPQNVV